MIPDSNRARSLGRNKSDHLTFSWIRTVSTKRNVKIRIPGTSQTATATKVIAKMRVTGFTLNVDAHMFYQDGAWRWSMTRENLASCDKIT